MFLLPAVSAQTVKRTAKSPSFFVPDNALKSKTEAEKLSVSRRKIIRGGATNVNNSGEAFESINFYKAPIDAILKEQSEFSSDKLAKYKKDIVNSYKLSVYDLQKLLQREYRNINKETVRMEAVLQHLKTASPAYRFANFQIDRQISQDMVKNRKRYKKLKEKFAEITEREKTNAIIYIIEAKNDLFWKRHELSKQRQYGWRGYTSGYHFKDITYISLFDDKYGYLFSYYRQHLNMLENRRISAPDRITGFYIDITTVNIYQKLFDDYITDLNRVGKGLDINNPQLLRQLNEMQDETISF